MRLDKYMQVSRIIKRRTVAKEVIDQDLVVVNDKPAKPSTEVKENDVIGVTFRGILRQYKVISIKPPKVEEIL